MEGCHHESGRDLSERRTGSICNSMAFRDFAAEGAPSAALASQLNALFGPCGMDLISVLGLFERFSTFSAVVFNAVLGIYFVKGEL